LDTSDLNTVVSDLVSNVEHEGEQTRSAESYTRIIQDKNNVIENLCSLLKKLTLKNDELLRPLQSSSKCMKRFREDEYQ